jgi:hypothetical protein
MDRNYNNDTPKQYLKNHKDGHQLDVEAHNG